MIPPDEPSSQRRLHEGWDHLKAGRPLAARACWRQAALHGGDAATAATRAIATLDAAVDLPAAARASYHLRHPTAPARRAAWDRRLREGGGGPKQGGDGQDGPGSSDLASMADAFGRLAQEDPTDADAWYNRGLVLAWQGLNREAVPSLERVVAIEAPAQFDRAVEAWMLAEVLRQGAGAYELADALRYSFTIDWDPGNTDILLREFPEIQSLPPPQAPGLESSPARQVELFEWPDRSILAPAEPAADRPDSAASLPVVLATLFIDRSARKLRLSSPRVDTLQQLEERLLARMPGGAGAYPGHPTGRGGIRAVREATPLPLPFLDADVWTVRLPAGIEPSRADDLRREWVEHYYENTWIHVPRQALDGLSPLAAAEKAHGGDVVIRAKLAAVVDFREQLARRPSAELLYHGYPFDRVRRRLGLGLGLAPADPAAVAVDPGDLSCAAPWELAALDPSSLDDHRLADAVAAASGLLDDAVTVPLAVELLRRSIRLAGIHLIGAVSPLVRRAMHDADPDAAVDWIERARPLADAATASMLDVWRAEILSRIGCPEESLRIYRGLIRSDASGAVAALDAAETLIDNRHHEQARPLLDAARDLARSAGLPWTERRARELLDGLR